MKTRSKSKDEPSSQASIWKEPRQTRSSKSKTENSKTFKPSAKENNIVPKSKKKQILSKKQQNVCQSNKERVLQPKEEKQISHSKKLESKSVEKKQITETKNPKWEAKMIGNYRLRGARKQVNYKEDQEGSSGQEEAPISSGLPKKLTGKQVINLGKSNR